MGFLVHLFLPHNSNNHRSKLLHNDSLLILVFILIILALSLSFVRLKAPEVLGVTSDISIEKLLSLTNKERENRNLPPLNLDTQLMEAATKKAEDMFFQNYWAHNRPNGETPWVFILDSGYDYIYAGENLARDFYNAGKVFDAWMASPGHRANILSSEYQDIGFAVVKGKLNNEETTLVVQLLGTRRQGSLAQLPQQTLVRQPMVFGSKENPLIDSRSLTRNITISLLGILILVLALDMAISQRRRLVRLVGHNLDHLIFLGSFIPLVLIGRGGVIL